MTKVFWFSLICVDICFETIFKKFYDFWHLIFIGIPRTGNAHREGEFQLIEHWVYNTSIENSTYHATQERKPVYALTKSVLPHHHGSPGFRPANGKFSRLQWTQHGVPSFRPFSSLMDLYHCKCHKRKSFELLLLQKRTKEPLKTIQR